MSPQIPATRSCKRCGMDPSRCKVWRRDGVGFLCDRCSKRRRIMFLGKRNTLSFDLRKDVCSECEKKGEMHLHHVAYIPIMPWACVLELCQSCHGSKTYGLGQSKVGRNTVTTFAKGELNPRWRGGVGQTNQRWRKTVAYERWREGIFGRDGYICTSCCECFADNASELVARHIQNADSHPELRYRLDNGETWCRKCYLLSRSNKKLVAAA
jgi:hypothetical protein